MKLFRTRLSRILFISIIVFITVGITYEYHQGRVIHPTEWYFIPVNSDETDNNSPTNKVIIRIKDKNSNDFPYLLMCAPRELEKPEVPHMIKEYKNVPLCGVPSIAGIEYKFISEYYREQVDTIWVEYYKDHIKKVYLGTLNGLIAVLLLTITFLLVSWVKKGEES